MINKKITLLDYKYEKGIAKKIQVTQRIKRPMVLKC